MFGDIVLIFQLPLEPIVSFPNTYIYIYLYTHVLVDVY